MVRWPSGRWPIQRWRHRVILRMRSAHLRVFRCCALMNNSIGMKVGTLTKSTMAYSVMTSPGQSAHAQWTWYAYGYCAVMSRSIVIKLGTLTKLMTCCSVMTPLKPWRHYDVIKPQIDCWDPNTFVPLMPLQRPPRMHPIQNSSVHSGANYQFRANLIVAVFALGKTHCKHI